MIHSKEELLRWQHDKEFQLEKINSSGYAIRFIHNPSEEVQMIAVKQRGLTIKYIYNPSEEVMIEALKQNPDAIMYIDIDKYPEMYEYYRLLTI